MSSNLSRGPNEFSSLYEKNGWTKENIQKMIAQRELTPFYQSSEEQTLVNDRMCSICYCFFPRINSIGDCDAAICSNCVLACFKYPVVGSECPYCRQHAKSIKANVSSVQLRNENSDDKEYVNFSQNKNGITYNYPSDTIEIAIQYGLDIMEVQEILNEGFEVADLI